MEDLGLVGSLAFVVAAALVGGGVARLLRLPTILGYLAAGVAIGPNTAGPSADVEDVQTVADLGVALLMFTLGVRFSLRELVALRGIAFLGGAVGTMLILGAGTLAGLAVGLEESEAIIAGMIASISSTIVALKLLEDRGLLTGPAGRIAVAVALVQDLIVVVYIIAVPVVGGGGENIARELGIAALTAIAVLAGVWIIGSFAIPRLLTRVARSSSRELFLLTVVALALGTASLSFEAGLSLAFGAFLAGLLVSESDYAQRTIAEVFPLREIFAVVFFVAIGMLVDPDSLVNDPEIVFGVVAVAVLGKIFTVSVASALLGFPPRAILAAALALANMGEFSFVLATEAVREDVIGPGLDEALLTGVLLSIAVSPLLFAAHEPIFRALQRTPVLGEMTSLKTESHVSEDVRLAGHAVVVGFGQAAQEVVRVLSARGFRYVVVDEDPGALRTLATKDVPYVVGNAALPTVLETLGVGRARVMVVTTSDPATVEAVCRSARDLNPRLDIVAHGATEEGRHHLNELGVSQIVYANFELGMQFVRHTLHRFGLTNAEIQAIVGRRRRDILR
ncbi:MAG TPA: cation:proton antiporter [Dehalococcoidia bacterium]